MPRPTGFLVLSVLTAGCAVRYETTVNVPGYWHEYLMPAGYQVGDTVSFAAVEYSWSETSGPLAADENGKTSGFRWGVDKPGVAEVIGEGRVVMRKQGTATLTISTKNSSARVNIVVVPRVASVRVTPTNPTIAVGDTIALIVSAFDSTGAALADFTGTSPLVVLEYDKENDPHVAGRPLTTSTSRHLFKGFKPGSLRVFGRVGVYQAKPVVDTCGLTVR